MRLCPDCHVVLEDPTLLACAACGADPPATGWPDDGVPARSRPEWALRQVLQEDGRRHYRAVDESNPELMAFRAGDSAPALHQRLQRLHTASLGAVLDADRTDDGEGWVWATLQPRTSTLQAWLRTKPAPDWQSACTMGGSLLEQLAQLQELDGLHVTSTDPEDIGLHPIDGVLIPVLPVDAVEELRTGRAPDNSSGSRTPGRWDAPEVADGAAPDADAWAYGLGLILYRALAGEHPFSGLGLRERLRRQSAGQVPPLPDEVVDGLPPGLQGTVLDLLASAPGERTAPALAAKKLRAFAAGRLLKVDAKKEPSKSASGTAARPKTAQADKPNAAVGEETRPKPAPLAGRGWSMAAIGIAIASFILAWFLIQGGQEPGEVKDGTNRAADTSTKLLTPTHVLSGPEECSTCHPSHVLEWERSVMAHAARSPLFNGLDMLIQEQFGRSADCPNGAGALRKADPSTGCRVENTGFLITGTGGEHWCVNCHAPLERRLGGMQAWSGLGFGPHPSREPMPSQLDDAAMRGITCTFCHQVTGPAANLPGQDGYVGNDFWRSPFTGTLFRFREPNDPPGIANSGYYHDPGYMFDGQLHPESAAKVHGDADPAAVAYLQSSEFCGSCHDVRLFGTDAVGIQRGEHYKRLRNAYTEWVAWKDQRITQGKTVYSCQNCHMSLFPGTCDPSGEGGEEHGCPQGTAFVPQAPGSYADGGASNMSPVDSSRAPHYFTGVDVPLTPEFEGAWADDETLDSAGVPLGVKQRRNMLLMNTFAIEIADPLQTTNSGPQFDGRNLTIPVTIENINAGHRVPAGFSQEREFWVHMTVTDADGRQIYEVGRVDRDDEDLRDKIFLQVNTNPDIIDGNGSPVGLFGADVADGPDVPQWFPRPELGNSTRFRGRGLINFQNGFLRCVTCIGVIAADGSCQPLPGQEGTRSARYDDGIYDVDTGSCTSNLSGFEKFYEIYFPVGSLDATRGGLKGPDAIIDTRSLPGDTPVTYVYELNAAGFAPPFTVDVSLNFRAFPPFLLRAFASYEQFQAARGLRPDGVLLGFESLDKLEVVELERRQIVID